ncbi:thioredoxin-disulfide reductase [Paenibacillus sp. GbtcB18]|uniref:thioredoxin-disulfide reductase n=1 Tax=Paenibacillus sp. GbtcB18 TaxID=2824763 RepID=UPI001C2F8819|nr:thioredoxin-disulfide reductase [Paenibacillus sp. GbtcB18]
MYKSIIIGTGPAGLTAAIYLARANLNPLVIEGQPGGQLTLTTEVENFPGFIDGIMGPDLMDNMRKQAERFGAKFIRGWVTETDLSKRPFMLTVDGVGRLETESLILSTGASANLLGGVPGEKDYIGRGVSTCATCDGFFFRNKEVLVVGGGDSAMEEANFLTKFASKVTVVHRRAELRASKIMQSKAQQNKKISWALRNEPTEVIAGDRGVTGLRVRNVDTGAEEIIKTDGIFIATGHTPNTSFLNGQIRTDHTGYIEVVPGTTETNIPGVFACGDVQDSRYRQAITAAGSGGMAAIDCEKFLESVH